MSIEKKFSSVGISSGKTGKTAWYASADPGIVEEHSSSIPTNHSIHESSYLSKPRHQSPVSKVPAQS